jgi:hypothetical protein
MNKSYFAVFLLFVFCSNSITPSSNLPSTSYKHNYHKIFYDKYIESEMVGSVKAVVCSTFTEKPTASSIFSYMYSFDRSNNTTMIMTDPSSYSELYHASDGTLDSFSSFTNGVKIYSTTLIVYNGYFQYGPQSYDIYGYFGNDSYIDSIVETYTDNGQLHNLRFLFDYFSNGQLKTRSSYTFDTLLDCWEFTYLASGKQNSIYYYELQNNSIFQSWKRIFVYCPNGFLKTYIYEQIIGRDSSSLPLSNKYYSDYVLDNNGNWTQRILKTDIGDTIIQTERRYLSYW